MKMNSIMKSVMSLFISTVMALCSGGTAMLRALNTEFKVGGKRRFIPTLYSLLSKMTK